MNKESGQIKESIIQILRQHEGGLGISEISKKINVYRATVSKYLILLEHQGVVFSKKVGPAKIYFLGKGRVQHISSPHQREHEVWDWIDDFIEEIKEEIKEEILGS
jgi:DNA-binding IclR family transcriptional regulator